MTSSRLAFPGTLLAALACGLAPSSIARADDGQTRLDVEVGKTIEVEVGSMRGLLCDDLTIINADLRDKNEQTNLLVITGVKLGTTSCRVGAVYPPFRLYEIHVVPPKHR